jgi:two-component system chemotaxis response regulator CheY
MTDGNNTSNQTSVPAGLKQSLSTMEMSLAEALETRRVLVADNDPLTSQILAAIAKKEGYEVVSVYDGREAYRMLKSDADFKAAVINMTMPNLRGLDILRHMKTEKRLMRIPVVVLSGEPGLKQMSDSFAAGATMFLAKPFTQDQLQRTLRIALVSRESKRKFPRAA